MQLVSLHLSNLERNSHLISGWWKRSFQLKKLLTELSKPWAKGSFHEYQVNAACSGLQELERKKKKWGKLWEHKFLNESRKIAAGRGWVLEVLRIKEDWICHWKSHRTHFHTSFFLCHVHNFIAHYSQDCSILNLNYSL